MSLFGIAASLGLLIYLSYRGHSILILAPLLAILAAVFSGGPPLGTYTQIFMSGLGGFLVVYFPIFLFGAVFGKLMEDSGSAAAIAQAAARFLGPKRAIYSVVLACAVLTYGGVSLFVVAFAVYPIARQLFKESGTADRFIPAAIALGSFTFTMTAMPGSPAIQNAIPMPYFDTTLYAAPGLGMIASVIMLGFGMAWLQIRSRKHDTSVAELTSNPKPTDLSSGAASVRTLHWAIGFLPIIVVLLGNALMVYVVLPLADTDYLASPTYGATTVASVSGIWAILVALAAACLVIILLQAKRLTSLKQSLSEGAQNALLPIASTASLVGFGTVIASLSGFDTVRLALLDLFPENPLISLSLAVNALAGITGSASGGMSIALNTLGATYLELGQQHGIDPALLHRVTSIATGGLDALPHNGAVGTLLSICGLTHRHAYFDIFVVAVLCPLIALVAVLFLGSTLGSF